MRKDDPRYEALQRNKADARSELAELKAHVSFQVVDRHAGDGPVVPITFPTRPEANEWITQ